MIETTCAICGDATEETELYGETLGRHAATFDRFSARRIPDRVHYRIVECRECSLLRSDPIFQDGELAQLYAGSTVTYSDEAEFVGVTYAEYLRQCLPLVPEKGRLLEIGCGHGFFLERALDLGFREVYGVEPSRHAVEIASPRVRGNIRNDLFQDGLFPPGSFDIVCAFQVFDHMTRPNDVLDACRRVLAPGGIALFINHDAGAWTNRLLGERSPIIDVEHIYLYNRDTMRRIFSKHGFDVLNVFPVKNRYPLYYWCQMSPLPAGLKGRIMQYLLRSPLGHRTLSWKAGNLGLIARAPLAGESR
jgi:SAM-dependent methyltransferase